MESAAVDGALETRKRPTPDEVHEEKIEEREDPIFHTRQCNLRNPCSCKWRMDSRKFLRELHKNSRKRGVRRIASKGAVTVKNIQQFDVAVKARLVVFLPPVDLATLSMVNHQWRKDVEDLVEQGTKDYVNDESRKGKVIVKGKARHQTWSRYLHLQMNCVHKLFVYYTAYKTGPMRVATPQWAFGEVHVDPTEPSKAILPNAWKFHGFSPWLQRKANGKGGEWSLLGQYKFGKAPKNFVQKVNEWASSIRVGDFLAVSFQQPDSTEVNWWEAQVWYVWRPDGREDPVVVYDAETNQEHKVHPRELVEYFKANPTHVVDAGKTPRTVCNECNKRDQNFYYCHLTKGHPMK